MGSFCGLDFFSEFVFFLLLFCRFVNRIMVLTGSGRWLLYTQDALKRGFRLCVLVRGMSFKEKGGRGSTVIQPTFPVTCLIHLRRAPNLTACQGFAPPVPVKVMKQIWVGVCVCLRNGENRERYYEQESHRNHPPEHLIVGLCALGACVK